VIESTEAGGGGCLKHLFYFIFFLKKEKFFLFVWSLMSARSARALEFRNLADAVAKGSLRFDVVRSQLMGLPILTRLIAILDDRAQSARSIFSILFVCYPPH
jgi:hypothetical protein